MTCPECGGDLVRKGEFCPDCGWDAALEADADHADGLDLPSPGHGRDEEEEAWDHERTVANERLDPPTGVPTSLVVVALVVVAALLGPVLAALVR